MPSKILLLCLVLVRKNLIAIFERVLFIGLRMNFHLSSVRVSGNPDIILVAIHSVRYFDFCS